MKIIFYDAKQYDIDSFEKQRKNYPDIESIYLEADLTEDTARLAEGCEGVCAFVWMISRSNKGRFKFLR